MSTASESSLAAREQAVDASLDASLEGLCSSWGAVALVALGGALVGVDCLGRVGASISQAASLAVHIAERALQGAADGRGKARGNGHRNRRRSGNGGLGHGKDADSKGENGGGVLHCDDGGRVIRDGTVRWFY